MENKKDYIEINGDKCCEVDNCMCVKHEDGKKYCLGCGNVMLARKSEQKVFLYEKKTKPTIRIYPYSIFRKTEKTAPGREESDRQKCIGYCEASRG